MTLDGPLSASAYELLGVASDASEEELRRAYRLRLRQTHPDTGGDAALFIRVQRAWELIGTAQARAVYDRGGAWTALRTTGATGTRPRTRSHGVAGARLRAQYRVLLAEHLGREVSDAEAFDASTVRSAPWEARRMLADALSQESTARTLDDLGIGFTAWHDAVAGEETLDHVVLSPTGLYGLMSEDFGDTVRFRQGEVIGRGVRDATPVADLLRRMRAVSRAARVRFGGAVLIFSDDDLDAPVSALGSVRGVPVVVVRRSAMRPVLRTGVPGARAFGGNEAFDVRFRLTHTVRVRTQ